LVQTPPQLVSPAPQLPHVPWLQIGAEAGQTYPQAPQLAGSEFRSVHIPLQQVAEVGQQTTFPQLPQSRLVLPLHARQAARH
jgi:hypothetical protein